MTGPMTETGATGPLAALTPARVATLALDRAIRTAALYEGKGALCADTVTAALRALHDLRGDRRAVRISVLPTGLAVEGDLDPDAETRSALSDLPGRPAGPAPERCLDEAALEAWCTSSPTSAVGHPAGRRRGDPNHRPGRRHCHPPVGSRPGRGLGGSRRGLRRARVALDGERRSVEDWWPRRQPSWLPPTPQPPTTLTVVPWPGRDAVPRRPSAHRALEATDARHDRARRLVVLSRPAALAQPGSTAALVAACLDCLRADGWAALALALRIAEEQASAAAWNALVRALQADEHRQAFDHALQRMHAPDATPWCRCSSSLGWTPPSGPDRCSPTTPGAPPSKPRDRAGCRRPARSRARSRWTRHCPGSPGRWSTSGPATSARPPTPGYRALRAVLAHRHPGTRLLAFRALDGDRHPDTHAALLETLGADDRGLLQHCRPQIAALVTDPQTADGATVSLLQVVEHPQFWDRPAPVRRLVLGLLAESTSADATAWLDAFLGRTAVFFGRAALREKQDLVKRVVAQHRRAP